MSGAMAWQLLESPDADMFYFLYFTLVFGSGIAH